MLRRLLIRLLVATSTFLFGVFISPPTFDCQGGIFEGRLVDSGGWFMSIYSRCSNSNWSDSTSEAYPTPSKARQVFEKRIREAVRVIERNEKLDSNGKRIGERAVTILALPDTGEQFGSVFWLDGRTIRSESAPSLKHALKMEASDP